MNPIAPPPRKDDAITANSPEPAAEPSHLAEARERFNFATDAAQIGYWFCDLPFDRLIWDARVKEHFWLPPDAEVDIGLFYDRIHPEDRQRTRDAIDLSIGTHTRYDIEYRTVSPGGGEKWIRATARTAYDAAGTPTRFDGVTQDITSLKLAEANLAESRRQLMVFADSIPALAWMADADGAIFWYNRRWYEYTGTEPELIQGDRWKSLHDPDLLPSVMLRWNHSIRTGEPFEMIFPLKGYDGVFRSFLTRVVPSRNDRGEIVRWFGTNTEVDELQRTREALQLSQERVRVALKNVPLVLYTTDRELRYTWIHRAHPAYPEERILGHRDLDIEPEKFRDIHQFKQSVLHSGQPARCEIRHLIGDKSEIFDYTAEPLRDAEGNITGLTVAALDITSMRLAEDALRKSEKLALVGRLAATMAHEINNPLESVVNLLYLIRSLADTEELRAHVQTAEEELARVSQIVTHSLRFHRQSAGPVPESLSSILESAVALYQGRIKQSDVRIVRDYRDTEPLLCLAGELRQVFANLIGNAFDATRAGAITLRCSPSTHALSRRRGIRVSIADTGHGIDPATLERIFEPFVTTKGTSGTGLGLWVSAEILKRHEATLTVRSSTRASRTGSVFSIFFPFDAAIQHSSQSLPSFEI